MRKMNKKKQKHIQPIFKAEEKILPQEIIKIRIFNIKMFLKLIQKKNNKNHPLIFNNKIRFKIKEN